jgi:hypothetical protein
VNADVYEQLAIALDRLPNGFPRTASQLEIQILKKIFSADEAALAGQLDATLEPVQEVSHRIGLPVEEVSHRLFKMARPGLVRRAG